jgi:putative ABC transport system ATP-binding protein
MTAAIELTDVKKSYAHPAGAVDVLSGVNARIERGETVAVLGPSGSGKSTLLSLLAGLDRADTGHVRLVSTDVGALTEKALTNFRARHLGIVFQQFHLLSHLSALENVALPLRLTGVAEARTRAAAALTQVGLGARLTHAPHELSGGECQRVAIARALVAEPDILLADEPSGNLDTKTGEQVMKLLFDLVKARGTTLVLVTHNEQLATWCNRRLTLSGGRLVPL